MSVDGTNAIRELQGEAREGKNETNNLENGNPVALGTHKGMTNTHTML
jgi:hypothetical protein